MYNLLDLKPLPGLSSPHLQMFFSHYFPCGKEPPSELLFVKSDDKDQLCCKVSTPLEWKPQHQTIALLHGLGGGDNSSYMVRLARKFYRLGLRVVRINLRGCGCSFGLNKLPYTCGDSLDVRAVLECLKTEYPDSPITLIGFSLGGNIIIKLAGELGEKASTLIQRMIALCPVIDLSKTLDLLTTKHNGFYHLFYLKFVQTQGKKWIKNTPIASIYEYDEKFTVPLWGYSSVHDYYEKCSSSKVISKVQVPLDIIFAKDDPFVDHTTLHDYQLSCTTKAWLTSAGGHMGFIGRSQENPGIYWADNLLLKWVKENSVVENELEKSITILRNN